MLADALFELPENTPTRRVSRKGVRKYPEKKYPKRVNRIFERSPLVVANAINAVNATLPKGCRSQRPARAEQWVKTVMKHEAVLSANAQCRANIIMFVLVIARSVDLGSMTVNPGWDYLIRETGLSRSTINRIRIRLHEAGLLGTVAKGRQAKYTETKDINERAIYVLLVPANLKSVEKTEPATGDYEVIAPTGAGPRERTTTIKAVATPRADFEDSPSGSSRPQLPANRPGHFWAGNATTKSAGAKGACRETEMQAASELRLRSFELRRASTADVAARCRPFFRRGWTVNDIRKALDTKPDGTKWAHSGAQGIVDVGKWLAYRLQAWMVDGYPMLTARQRDLVRARELKAQQRAALDERAKRLESLQDQEQINREGAARARAILRGSGNMDNNGKLRLV
jgi:hypothetical protein